jgi:hypothetical protein
MVRLGHARLGLSALGDGGAANMSPEPLPLRISISLHADEYEYVHKLAQAQRSSVAFVIRTLIQTQIAEARLAALPDVSIEEAIERG